MTLRPLFRPTLLALALGAMLAAVPAQAASYTLGGGANFWRTLDGLPSSSDVENIEDDGYSYVFSYQLRPRGIFTLQIDVEYYEDGYAGSVEEAFAPQVFLLVGRGFYAGVGAGVTISDGLEDSPSDAFYMGRIGWDIALLGPIELDLHATYRFESWDEL